MDLKHPALLDFQTVAKAGKSLFSFSAFALLDCSPQEIAAELWLVLRARTLLLFIVLYLRVTMHAHNYIKMATPTLWCKGLIPLCIWGERAWLHSARIPISHRLRIHSCTSSHSERKIACDPWNYSCSSLTWKAIRGDTSWLNRRNSWRGIPEPDSPITSGHRQKTSGNEFKDSFKDESRWNAFQYKQNSQN